MHELAPGDVLWVDFGRTVGTEQRGRRPAVVVGSAAHASETGDLVIVVPCTSRFRGWRSHLPLTGELRLEQPTYAMTEQPRAISRQRIRRHIGSLHGRCRQDIALAVRSWVDAPPLFER